MKKNAFTLVELLAIIVILAIVLVISVPQIASIINKSKENSILSSLKLLANSAESEYISRDTFGTLNQVSDPIECSDIVKSDSNYSNCTISFEGEEAHVTLLGKGKFSGYLCSGNKKKAYCYVKDGLMVMYDGINNTFSGHNNASSTWNDLSGNGYNGTISGATWGTNNLSFDGVNDYVIVGNYLSGLFLSNNTIEIVIKFSEIANRAIIIGNYNVANNINVERTATDCLRIYWNNGISDFSSSTAYLINNSLMSITLSFNKSSGTITPYISNKIKTIISNGNYKNYNYKWNHVRIGIDNRSTPGETALNGQIYAVRVYNRALTTDEIQTNYNMDKIRYGI